jgi:hypothetical protein
VAVDELAAVDLHQHLWPELLVDRLRTRSQEPFLRGWTLHVRGARPFEASPADHVAEARARANRTAGIGTACLSLSAPLGIEALPDAEADELLDGWHKGAAELPAWFRAWASVRSTEPDLEALTGHLASGFIGVQLPATDVATPAGWDRLGPLLEVAERAGRPVLVHPGPERPDPAGSPGWWAPVVGYVTQMQAAWWAWHAVGGRRQHPRLRLVFAAGAGLAPVHHERHAARGGAPLGVDPEVYVDTSSYGPQGLDALVRVLGIDALALGSDRPYAEPGDPGMGEAANRAIRVTNPRRVLHPDDHPGTHIEGDRT